MTRCLSKRVPVRKRRREMLPYAKRSREFLFRNRPRKSLSRGASPERLWGISERTSVRLVFLFFGGFLLGCHEVFPPFERFVLPRLSTEHLDARATQQVVGVAVLPQDIAIRMRIVNRNFASVVNLVKRLRANSRTPYVLNPTILVLETGKWRCLCDNFRRYLCQSTKFSAQN
jgi:hypothetical protein